MTTTALLSSPRTHVAAIQSEFPKQQQDLRRDRLLPQRNGRSGTQPSVSTRSSTASNPSDCETEATICLFKSDDDSLTSPLLGKLGAMGTAPAHSQSLSPDFGLSFTPETLGMFPFPGSESGGKGDVANDDQQIDQTATTTCERKPSGRKRMVKKEVDAEDDESRSRSGLRERNRIAANKCRIRKKAKTDALQEQHDQFKVDNTNLRRAELALRDELQQLRSLALDHHVCGGDCSQIHHYNRQRVLELQSNLHITHYVDVSDMMGEILHGGWESDGRE